MNIYTITLNPAYDVHAYTEHFAPFHENLAVIQSKEAGGKGLNISRALHNAHIPHRTVIVLGNENSADYRKQLDRLNLDCLTFEKEGYIRENLTLHCKDAPETRISFYGFKLSDSIFSELVGALTLGEETIVTFTGRNPDGVSMEAAKNFLKQLKQQDAKIVLDSRSFSLEDIYEVQPWLIKPNQEEISAFFDCSIETVEEASEKAKLLASKGISNVMISLGGQGALLAAGGKLFYAVPPNVEVVSTIGAGDSSIAGFIAAANVNKSSAECLKSAVAFGTAACLTEGSQPPQTDDVNRLYQQIRIMELP